jgi:hypothetical protein
MGPGGPDRSRSGSLLRRTAVNDGQAVRGKQNVHIRDVTGSSRADPAWCPWSRRWWPWAPGWKI